MSRPTTGRTARAGLCAALGLMLLPLASNAQDSTSSGGPGIPGDALDPHLTNEQQNDYVVDLTVFGSSWGHTFGLAPIAKASAQYSPAPTFFNAQLSAQGLSVDQLVAVAFARDAYAFWNEPGRGVNDDPNSNNVPNAILDTSAAVGNQFAFTFAEFSEGNGVSFNNLVGGVVNYELDTPSRLYVSRVVAGANSPDWNCNLSQFGMGGVDSAGYVHVRGDGFGSGPCAGMTELLGQNWFRIDTLSRNTAVQNVISDAGGTDATVRLLQNTTVCDNGFNHTHSPPTCIPSSLTLGLPITIGSAFSCPNPLPVGQFVYGDSMPMSSTTSHLTGADDARGLVAYTKANFTGLFGPSTTLGTASIIGRTGSDEDRMQIWGLDSAGNPQNAISLQLPSVITDNDDGWPSNTLGAGTLEFTGFGSQVAFRGGNGHIAVGSDQLGNLIAAGVVAHPSATGNDHPNNLIAVARVSPTGATEWTVAAYNGTGMTGKAVLDGANGNVVGRLISLEDLTGPAGDIGPSMSSPMIDSVGNIYFIAPVDMTTDDDGVGLFRAVYDPASFSYQLELLFQSGRALHGQNSDTDFELRFITLSDGNSVSSGAPFSGNVGQDAHTGLDPSTLPISSTQTLGGLVLNTSIIYDVDGNGVFETTADDPATPDEQYSVLLYVGSTEDCNGNGVPDDVDIADGTSTDLDGDGIPDECGAGTPICFGDGGGTFCPCGNIDPSGLAGCTNSSGSGASLSAGGDASITNDTVVLTAMNVLPGQPGLFFQGDNSLMGGNGVVFGDGLRCCGMNVIRLATVAPDASGCAASDASCGTDLMAPIPAGPITQHPSNNLQPGDAKCYQFWYRDPLPSAPCGSTFNLTNAVEVTWGP